MTTYDVPSRLAFVVPEDAPCTQVFLMALPDGHPLLLTDTAAAIWILAADGELDVAGALGGVVGRPRDEVAESVDEYLEELVAAGLLETRE